MLQLIINKDTEDGREKDVMIINSDTGNMIFNKETNKEEKPTKLYNDILKLLDDYLK